MCLCVYVSSVNIVRFYIPSKVRTAFVQAFLDLKSWIFDSVEKLWREKANMPNEYLLTAISYGADAHMQRHFARIFEDRAFSGSFKV